MHWQMRQLRARGPKCHGGRTSAVPGDRLLPDTDERYEGQPAMPGGSTVNGAVQEIQLQDDRDWQYHSQEQRGSIQARGQAPRTLYVRQVPTRSPTTRTHRRQWGNGARGQASQRGDARTAWQRADQAHRAGKPEYGRNHASTNTIDIWSNALQGWDLQDQHKYEY